jgi:hypothetical protein
MKILKLPVMNIKAFGSSIVDGLGIKIYANSIPPELPRNLQRAAIAASHFEQVAEALANAAPHD